MVSASMRGMMLPPQRHEDAFDLAQQASELSLVEIQEILRGGSWDERRVVYNEAFGVGGDYDRWLALCKSFEAGYTLPASVLEEFYKHALTERVPDEWSSLALFEDDVTFVQERFALMLNYNMRRGTSVAGWEELALSQAQRMLAAGRVDPAYLRGVSMLRMNGLTKKSQAFADFERELQAYLPLGEVGASDLENITMLRGFLRGMLTDAVTRRNIEIEIERSQARVTALTEKREWLFREIWLPELLSSEEYASVRHLSNSLVLELYSREWERGYVGYRAAMVARGEVFA